MSDPSDNNLVIRQMEQRLRTLASVIATNEANRQRHQHAADSFGQLADEARTEREQTKRLIEILSNQDTVTLDVPRDSVIRSLQAQRPDEGGEIDQTT